MEGSVHKNGSEEHADLYSYFARHISEAVDISRSSLMYYERIGLIEPKRKCEKEYRKYSDTDVFKLFAYSGLRTVGYQAAEIVDLMKTKGDLLDSTSIEECGRKKVLSREFT